MNRALFLLLIISFGVCSYAQTVIWQMQPSDYSEISRLNYNLYAVARNGKIGLIRADGTPVTSMEIDNICPYYEHKALVLCNDAQGERVMGCLTDAGKYNKFANRYYTLKGQAFYSDDLLTVRDEKGRVGYIDEIGAKVLGFDGKYDKIKPFIEGYAAMFKNKKFFLVDKDGSAAQITTGGFSSLLGGTNVYKDLAYVWDEDGKFYTYNTVLQTCKKVKTPSDTKSFDYLYRFASVSKMSKQVPYSHCVSSGVKGPEARSKGGMLGYVLGNTLVVPYQFTEATNFEDGYAVVNINGKKGILKCLEGIGFSIGTSVPQYKYYEGEAVICSFELTVPAVWQQKKLEIVVKDSDGVPVSTTNKKDVYQISVHPAGKSSFEYSVIVCAEDLKLYEDTINFNFTKKVRCQTCKKDIDVCQYGGKHPVKLCPTCHKDIDACQYKGNHPVLAQKCSICNKDVNVCKGKHPIPAQKLCPTCHKAIKDCKWKGVH